MADAEVEQQQLDAKMASDTDIQTFKTTLIRTTNMASSTLARATIALIRDIVNKQRWQNARQLLRLIRAAGRQIETARPGESVIGNMIKRGLRVVRDAYDQCVREEGLQDGEARGVATMASLHNILVQTEKDADYTEPFKQLKSIVMDKIRELLDELANSAHNIAEQSVEHIHTNEVVMTMGYSETVQAFLLEAHKKGRSFNVIVAEAAPACQGHAMARKLADAGVQTTVVTDGAVYAIISRVNKVIIGTSAVMADGGLMAENGAHALCMAAKAHSVPVLVCAGMFKLCPRYLCSYDQDAFNSLGCPAAVAQFSDATIAEQVECLNPLFDYVPPELVTLFISNLGGNAPSYVYRLLSEYYHEDDYEL
eukprot:TRINITY_DN11916_c0_g1_i3.p1 TRINITY_DN11916_c0_g1~~TRINITY_DN11916_c0_g1_i3.p1  ORF type:complete len:367 (+),score=84.01 TRINITY_DN11916_c0_g1_i3:113-1213(+)